MPEASGFGVSHEGLRKALNGEDDPTVQEVRVFTSYSQQDRSIVEPIVAVIRAVGCPVFLDRDSIPPGSKWRVVIETAIARARRMLLFWCCHAKESIEVGKEVSQAIDRDIGIVPALLDDTALTSTLAQYQFVDLRGLGHPGATRTARPRQDEGPRSSRRVIGNYGCGFPANVRPQYAAAMELIRALHP